MSKLISFTLLCFCLVLTCSAAADVMSDMDRMSGQLNQAIKDIDRGRFDADELSTWTKTSIKMKSDASLCVANNEAALLDLQSQMDGLGEKVKGEDVEVTKKRAAYQKEKDELGKVLAKCNLYVTTSNEVSARIKEAEKSYFKQKYLARSPDIIELVFAWLNNPIAILSESGDFIFSHSGIREIDLVDLVLSLAAVLLAILTGAWLRKKLFLLESKRQWQDEFSENLLRATLTTVGHFLPALFGSAVAAISTVIMTLEVAEMPFVTEFFVGLLIYLLSIVAIRLLFSPYPPAKLFIHFTPGIAEALAKRLKVIAILGYIGYLAFYTVFSQSIVESNLMLMRNIFSFIFVINIVWTLQVITRSPRMPKLRYISILVILVILASLVAELMGYRNLAFSSRRIIILTFIVFLGFIGIAKIFRDLFNAVDDGTYPWCQRLHKTLAVENGQRIPGLIWLRLLMTIVIWGSFAVLLINTLDYSGSVIEHVRAYIVNGFDVGGFRIIPAQVLWALFIFGVIVTLSGWIRSQMENNWLRMMNMGQGARDAVVTITGYVLFIIALVAGLSAAGFDFGNVAIVAGALSVGIGFGLQNVVNNFVSGLILLFERPVRKGDWIMVGGTEGVVKEIQIRSTRIETFDRSDVIVPNSELISNQVTNWMLSSRSGRAIIPVGVAYGTDTQLVRDILLDIADKCEYVNKSGEFPAPVVLFRAFGESSLDFELRIFLREIDRRLSVISEINFAIDKAFREAGIEIPFPQRDLHVKSLPENFTQKMHTGDSNDS